VTDRGRPVARLVPPAAGFDLERLVEEGLLIPPRAPGDLLELGPPIPLQPGTRLPSELVSELRDE
jgi:antitoxin (DNA-binding transcriptional repressor) of toxin-antitoxin stability system